MEKNKKSNSSNGKSRYIVEVKNLKQYFPIKSGLMQRVVGHVKAVDDISFKIERGKTMGLVGESGCGKTTVGKTLLRLPTDGSPVVAQPVLAGTTMLVVTRNGGLFAFRPE